MLTLQQAAQRLGISESTMRRIVHRGEIAAVRVGLRKLMIPEDELERYIERQRPYDKGKVETLARAA